MKEDLLKVYLNKLELFKQVSDKFPNDDLSGPFLMSPKKEFHLQPLPLLVIGQETNGWSYFVEDPLRQMQTYENYEVGKNYSNTALWNTVRKIENVLGNKPCSCEWSNLSRFDLYGGRSHGRYQKAIAVLDNLLHDEVKIVRPQMCLFFTGPNLDIRIERVFKGLRLEPQSGWEPNQLCRLVHSSLPPLTFRSYHPRFLRLKSLESSFIDFIATVAAHSDNTMLPHSLPPKITNHETILPQHSYSGR